MSLRIIVHSEARSDVIDIAYYIAEDNLVAADRFAEAVNAAYNRLAEMPGIRATREYGNPVLNGMRGVAGTRFPKASLYLLPCWRN